MAKASSKKPKESKCRGSGAPLEGRDWVRIGGNKWLREVAEKQGKFIPLEYREKSGAEFEKDRASRAEEADKQRSQMPAAEEQEETPPLEEEIPDAEAPLQEPEEVLEEA